MKKNNLKTAAMIFLTFFRIGCFTFGGGWAIVAQMEEQFVNKRKLITKEELLDIVAVGKSLPGIMITNDAMLFGCQVAGIPGGIAAVLGITAPAVIILSIVTVFYGLLKDNHWVKSALSGIQAAVVPIIVTAAMSLGGEIVKERRKLITFLIAIALLLFAHVGNVPVVFLAVAAALVWRTFIKKKEEGGAL